ncbi:MAG TPA: lysylphosphatidylglycerol synthase domain-containing protein [Acidimicrobiales bacterium]|nr:lysylphosphatidylglycerol synthase domain-containing protein [Acidimicrobiales bacterium]
MATGFAYQQFRKRGVDSELTSAALSVAGIVSTISFTVVVAVGAVLSGNPDAAAGTVGGALLVVALFVLFVVSLRSSAGRARLEGIGTRWIRFSRRIPHRSVRNGGTDVDAWLESVSAIHLGVGPLLGAVAYGAINWLGDAFCLVFAIMAIGDPVPWRSVFLVWLAGNGAASFSPAPAGIGVVDLAVIAVLTASGLHGPRAVAAVLLYRIVAFKAILTTAWLVQRAVAQRRIYAKS